MMLMSGTGKHIRENWEDVGGKGHEHDKVQRQKT